MIELVSYKQAYTGEIMPEEQEYEVEIEFEGRVYVKIKASTAEEAKAKAKRYNPSAQEVRDGVESFTVDPWDNLQD